MPKAQSGAHHHLAFRDWPTHFPRRRHRHRSEEHGHQGHAQDAGSCAPAVLAALNYVGALGIVQVLSLTLQKTRVPERPRGPLAVVASVRLVVGLQTYGSVGRHPAA